MPVVSETFSPQNFFYALLGKNKLKKEKRKEKKVFHVSREMQVFVTRTKLTGTKALKVLIAEKYFGLKFNYPSGE